MKAISGLKAFGLLGITIFLMFGGIGLQGQEYGFMYTANQTGSNSVATATWHTVGSGTGNALSEGSTSTNWTFASNRLTAGSSLPTAVYLVKFSLSFGAGQATWQVGISKNGATPNAPVNRRTISSLNKDAGVVYGVSYMSLTADDFIELQVQQESGSSQDFDPVHAQVVVVEMTDNTTNYYGGMAIENNTTAQTGLTNGVYTQLTGFSASGLNNDWTVSSSELTAGSSAAGTYLVSFSASYAGDGSDNSPPTFDIGIAKGSSTDPTTIITRRKTSSSDVGNIGGIGILSISASDPLRLEVKPTSGNSEITLYYSSITLYKLSGTSTAPRAHMDISSDTDQTISAQSTYYTISGFSGGSNLNNWTYSSNTLNATTNTASAGNYLVDYSVSFSKASGTGSDVAIAAFSVFLGSTEQTELTIQRKLSSDTDVGAAGGTGIINIASSSAQLTLRVSNTSSDDNLTIKTCTVNLHRFVTGSHDGSLPVELSKWEASSSQGDVRLSWVTESEVENQGFIIERRLDETDVFSQIASFLGNDNLKGMGSTSTRSTYHFVDKDVVVGQRYQYRLIDVDYSNRLTYHGIVNVVVTREEMLSNPTRVTLLNAYPNPFNPITTIHYGLPDESHVSLIIYDLQGKLIKTVENGPKPEGWYEVVWNGDTEDGSDINTGLYIARLVSGENSEVIKLLYLK